MKLENITVGMQVVARTKSTGRQDSEMLLAMQAGKPVFVVRKDSEGTVSLSTDPSHTYGEHFLADDLSFPDAPLRAQRNRQTHDAILHLECIWRDHKEWLSATAQGRKLIADLCELDSQLSTLELEIV